MIKKGDIVDIIFPATCCNEKEISQIKNYVKSTLGLVARIILEKEITPTSKENSDNEFPSYRAEKRFEQLYQALKSDSKIIWCARGGYGSGDLLPMLAQAKKIKQTKLFIGFSDIVSIGNFLQQKWGWKIIAAPVLLQLARGDIKSESEQELKSLIFGEKTRFNYDLISLNKSTKLIKSEIVGGCLSVLAGHFSGNYQINFANKILFLEDEGEDGERLDRYFRQIIEVILKTKKSPSAILLGNFIQANLHGNPQAKNIKIAIDNLVGKIFALKLSIPVFTTKDGNLGHSENMRPLLLGNKAEIKNSQLKIWY
jgi:muramoyltetrapeptide carboxypeptidase LdcA involved in peptidoglycan recycling